jgi:hypothetical protein
VNKINLPHACNFDEIDAVRVSAQIGEGLPELGERISRRLLRQAPHPGAANPFPTDLFDKAEQAARRSASYKEGA